MTTQYNDQILAQTWHNLDLKLFWLKEMIEGLGTSLTAV